ncbi:MAG: 50S ribosomal protein L1 [Candidatus Aenigmatarchaeota archaeon]|mgnify:CR=1 FL=1|nr:MAG: 50S ribosomal protein L1 [Candidatus Aenigmarchaeota archaeon]
MLEKIQEARKRAKPRRFKQSFDLIINLKGVDLTKPENRFSIELLLPAGRGKEQKVAVFADSLVGQAKSSADLVIQKPEIEKLAKDKKKLKKIANEYDWFLAEAPLMPLIGKTWGQVLGPRGKMPKPVPPNVQLKPLIDNLKNSVRLVLKTTPVIMVPVGTEDMQDEAIQKNIEAVLAAVKEKLPKGKQNLRSVYLKLTMGEVVRLDGI